jgi:choice-of-anchor A domain-containing protein
MRTGSHFMFKVLLIVVSLVLASQASAVIIDLGPATGYNVFVKENFTQPGADSQGKIAVGGNANIGQYDVGVNYDKNYASSGIPFWQNQSGYADVLVVGGDLKTSGWGNIKGNAIVGGTVSDATGHSVEGTLTQAAPIDFNNAFDYLTKLSGDLNALTANTSVDFKYNNWLLLNPNPDLASDGVAVVDITGSMLQNATDLSAPLLGVDSTLVVNVSGKDIHFDSLNYGARENLAALNLSPSHILYNFFEAENITFDYGGFYGNILAPNANFIFQSGDLSGQVIAKSWTGNWGAQANLWNGFFVPPVANEPPKVAVSEPPPFYLVLIGMLIIFGIRRTRS